MKTVWVQREIGAPAESVWALMTDLDRWPEWGPSVRRAELSGGRLEAGATGVVTTVLGLHHPFEITDHVEGERWDWKVAGVRATSHTVEPSGPGRCRVGFGVPWYAAPYLAVCRVALRRIESIAMQELVRS